MVVFGGGGVIQRIMLCGRHEYEKERGYGEREAMLGVCCGKVAIECCEHMKSPMG